MKIVVIGVGAMGKAVIQDLMENPEVREILVADFQEDKAKECAASLKDLRIKGCFVDAHKIEETADLIRGYDAVVNSAQYYVNMNIMKACLKAGCHYNDLGGMFHFTRKQLELFDVFKKAGLTAVLGIGSAPGITNVLSRYAYDRLDQVEAVRISYAVRDMTDMKGIDVFAPPYSIKTIMEEFSDDSVQFIDGEYKTLPALSGTEEVMFPEPIGKGMCFHTLHSEPATIPASFKNKGVKEVTWRLSLPAEFDEKARILASVGFASNEPVEVKGSKVIPREVLAAVIEKNVKEKLEGVKLKLNEIVCIRSHVIGKKGNKKIEYTVDCILRTPSRGTSLIGHATGVPPSIVAQMQAKGMIKEPGVWAPEKVVEPEYFFEELAKREFQIQFTMKEDLIKRTQVSHPLIRVCDI